MTFYMQNGADDGTVIGYPDDTGSDVEEFLFECGHGTAYSSCPVREISEEDLLKQGFKLEDITEVSAEDIAKIEAIMEQFDNGEIDYDEAGDDVNDLICDYVVFPPRL